MLKHWDSHAEYQHFISQAVESLNPSQLKKFSSMSDSLNKLTSMNLDPVGQFLAPYYSNTGRPAINQPQILRSFILMLDRGFTSLTNWIAELALMTFLLSSSAVLLTPSTSVLLILILSIGFGFKILLPKSLDARICSLKTRIKNLLLSQVKEKNCLTDIRVSQKKLLLILNPDGFSLFIMKNSSSSSFLSLPLSLLWNLG